MFRRNTQVSMKCYLGKRHVLFSVLPKITVMEPSMAERASHSWSTPRVETLFRSSSGITCGCSPWPQHPSSATPLLSPHRSLRVAVLLVLKRKPISQVTQPGALTALLMRFLPLATQTRGFTTHSSQEPRPLMGCHGNTNKK